MCTIFKSAICRVLPQAALVVDHFHLVQLANQTLTEVRRRVTVTHRGRRGRKGNREWDLRNRLTRSAARMRGEHVDALLDELSNLPKAIGEPITAAWNAKEDLLDLLATARTRPDREQVRDLLYRFADAAPTPAFPNCSAWPQPSRRGGQRSWRSCTPGSPTPPPKAPTGSSRPSPATPTASATPSTSAYAPAAQPPGEPVGTSTPANFVEPAPVIVLASGVELSVPLVSAWL
jgi:hypothetical protein